MANLVDDPTLHLVSQSYDPNVRWGVPGGEIIIVGLKYLAEYLVVKAIDYAFSLTKDLFIKKLKDFFGAEGVVVTEEQIGSLYDLKDIPLSISVAQDGAVIKSNTPYFAVECTEDGFEWLAKTVACILTKKINKIPQVEAESKLIKSGVPGGLVNIDD